MTKPKFKITYGTLSAANPELHQAFDLAVEQAKAKFGTNYPMIMPAHALDGLATLALDEGASELFLGGNAQRVFKID